MQEWRKLTPEEQWIARENYKSARRLPAGKRQDLKHKWEEYSRLPAEEKEKLKRRASGRSARPLTFVPPTVPARKRLPAAPLPAWQPGDQLPQRILPPGAGIRNQMPGIRKASALRAE
jgi:hypothetical protein